MSLNGKQFPNEGVYLGMDNEKKFFMGYRTLFDASGIDHSNTELQITHDTYISGDLVLLFALTPARSVSVGHKSHPENGNIRI